MRVRTQAHAYYPGSTPKAGDVWLNMNLDIDWGARCGGGTDRFSFDTALSSNVDKITDFSGVSDLIHLEKDVFTKLALGALISSNYRENNTGAAQEANDYIIYEVDAGRLYYDSNGNAAGGRALVATLWDGATTHHTAAEISYTDFVVV